MQLVLSGNRIIAHGENFLAMGGVVINTETGAKYENATVAECNGCPSDIGEVGYEYHAGVFVPCAPYGKGNNNGFFMEVCESCATPRNSGIPIKGVTLWENASPDSVFYAQTISLDLSEYRRFYVVFFIATSGGAVIEFNCILKDVPHYAYMDQYRTRIFTISDTGITFENAGNNNYANNLIPCMLIGYKY